VQPPIREREHEMAENGGGERADASRDDAGCRQPRRLGPRLAVRQRDRARHRGASSNHRNAYRDAPRLARGSALGCDSDAHTPSLCQIAGGE